MRRHFAAFMPRKSLDIRTTEHPVSWEKGYCTLFPASGEDGSGQRPDNGSRDWSLVGFGARPQGLKPSISAIFKVLLSLFFSARFFIDYLTLPLLRNPVISVSFYMLQFLINLAVILIALPVYLPRRQRLLHAAVPFSDMTAARKATARLIQGEFRVIIL